MGEEEAPHSFELAQKDQIKPNQTKP